MNPFLIFGALAAADLIWLLYSFLYRPLGKLGLKPVINIGDETNP